MAHPCTASYVGLLERSVCDVRSVKALVITYNSAMDKALTEANYVEMELEVGKGSRFASNVVSRPEKAAEQVSAAMAGVCSS